MSIASLKAKGVVPLSSKSAVLHGWVLRFNVQHFFRNEGGVGNIECTDDPQDQVLGILHELSDDALELLDAAEAYGYGYDRITLDVEVDVMVDSYASKQSQSQTTAALTYVGMPDFIDNNCLPSRRYLNIILDGAIKAGLNQDYIEQLKIQPVLKPKNYPLFVPPEGEYPTFDEALLTKYPLYTALNGFVFDMSDARPHHEFLKGFFGGKDMTLFHLKRLDSSNNEETIDDIKHNHLNSIQEAYLNSFLNEYAVEYCYVGRFNYHCE
ncbi:gamma-glutamylcyclotransferase [Colwellia sp. MSW7]|uniref:Gamma-glutamylcyclotransferase n=1 Tax=Colwellia maritima TaxID=2912588 RepID=A0ABS9X7Q4_9GAMM|nr:gamma-glutamylcyclotransferase [Colwellia maritima]